MSPIIDIIDIIVSRWVKPRPQRDQRRSTRGVSSGIFALILCNTWAERVFPPGYQGLESALKQHEYEIAALLRSWLSQNETSDTMVDTRSCRKDRVLTTRTEQSAIPVGAEHNAHSHTRLQSGGSSEQLLKRTRVGQGLACERCRLGKVKCDLQRPCGRCARRGL
jgi:hypothetical protein